MCTLVNYEPGSVFSLLSRPPPLLFFSLCSQEDIRVEHTWLCLSLGLRPPIPTSPFVFTIIRSLLNHHLATLCNHTRWWNIPGSVWKSAKFQISSPTRNFFRYSSRVGKNLVKISNWRHNQGRPYTVSIKSKKCQSKTLKVNLPDSLQ